MNQSKSYSKSLGRFLVQMHHSLLTCMWSGHRYSQINTNMSKKWGMPFCTSKQSWCKDLSCVKHKSLISVTYTQASFFHGKLVQKHREKQLIIPWILITSLWLALQQSFCVCNSWTLKKRCAKYKISLSWKRLFSLVLFIYLYIHIYSVFVFPLAYLLFNGYRRRFPPE
jgi:hypothetical protein